MTKAQIMAHQNSGHLAPLRRYRSATMTAAIALTVLINAPAFAQTDSQAPASPGADVQAAPPPAANTASLVTLW
jgi:hypothetical protein